MTQTVAMIRLQLLKTYFTVLFQGMVKFSVIKKKIKDQALGFTLSGAFTLAAFVVTTLFNQTSIY